MKHQSARSYHFLYFLLFAGFALGIARDAPAKDSFKISGFIGNSTTEAAANVTVKLLDGDSGKVLDVVQTGFLGKYTFKDLMPGYYVIQAEAIKREVMVKTKDVRMDINLSSKDGSMQYAKPGDIAAAIGGITGGAAGAPAAGPAAGANDADLMQTISGVYWGYEGSTETSLTLCPNGTFSDASESSYSGRSSDQYGNESLAWGTASQGGSRGNWRVQGNMQQGTIGLAYTGGSRADVRYQAIDQICYKFGSKSLCRKGPAQCR
jgi:hypothetical protein